MNIVEMHVWFRQYVQQMGMQNTRAILPEQIDLLINTSISDTVNEIVTNNVEVTNDRVITDNSKLGQINALRTLYKVATLNISTNDGNGLFTIDNGEEHIGRLYLKHSDNISFIPDYRFLVDFAINYVKTTNGASVENGKLVFEVPTNNRVTNWFPVRIIDDAYLADTLNDYILSPRLRTPILTVYGDHSNTIEDTQFDLYIGEGKISNEKIIYPELLVPNKLRMSYIANPNKVKYVSDLGGNNIDCDLPESLHVPILKHAVDLYRISVSGSLSQQQAQNTNAQRENIRNNARPTNEGYV